MKANRLTTAVAVLAAATAMLAACSAGDAAGNGASEASASAPGAAEAATSDFDPTEPVTLNFTWWGADDRASRYEEVLAKFNEKYPNITVVRNWTSWGDYWTARSVEAAGRALPDVMQTDVQYIGQYANPGLLLDLQPYVGELISLDGYDENLLAAGTVGGALVGLPQSTTELGITFNKDLLDELGVAYPADDMTWDDLYDYIREVNAAGAARSPAVYTTIDFTGAPAWFFYHLLQEGVEPFAEDGTPGFTQEDVVEWLDSVADLREDGAFFPADRTVALSPKSAFSAGEATQTMEWSTLISNGMKDLGTENLAIVPPPFGSDTSNRNMAQKPGMLLSVAANTQHPEAAALLVDFISNSPESAAIFGTSRGVPATQAGRDAIDPSTADSIVLEYEDSIRDQFTSTYPALPSNYGVFDSTWIELHEQLSYGELTTEEFAEQLFTDAVPQLGS
ncbi:MAG TPA: sugar ABC transporter substrate-binding protein [Micrococcales bacterium]|uniref:ABC transporter substrate-binding protein n=1 Tax=Miniimonas arenae TaxID=676201 RepID=UPI000ED6490A|nr:extracellular solute-binding protein [Miniimonas arenae]HCX84681.1 sugar ABC transporter substrate-binding protein [Micrococcales bacterium]